MIIEAISLIWAIVIVISFWSKAPDMRDEVKGISINIYLYPYSVCAV